MSTKETLIYALPLKDAKQASISPHFGEAPYFVLVTVSVKDKRVRERKVIANPFMHVEQGKGILVAELLNKYPIDVILTMKSFKGKGPFYVFSNAAVESLQTTEDTVENALENLGILFDDNEIKDY